MQIAPRLARSPTFGLPPRGRRVLQRGALYVVLASVAASALIAAFALLVGEFGQTQGKLLSSALSVTGASAIALACGFAWERRRLGVVPPLGIALGVAGFGLMIVAIWAEPDHEAWPKSIGTLLALAAAATHASVVSPFGLAHRFRLAFAAAYGLNVLLTALVVYALWTEQDDTVFWRVTGTVAILLLASTIAIPVLRRLGAGAPAAEAAAGAPARFCPGCGEPLASPGADSCAACGARFEVRLTPR
jgi:hypothetical protein